LNTLNRPVNPARSEDAIALLERAEHRLRLPALFVRRSDDEEIEDETDGQDRQDLKKHGEGAVGAGTLEQSDSVHFSRFDAAPWSCGASASPLEIRDRKESRKDPNEL